MIELLEIEHACMLRKSHDGCSGDCCNGDLVQDDNELHEMYTDVIHILREQTARVMNFEVIKRRTVVWLEQIGVRNVILAIGGASAASAKCFITEDDMSIALLDCDYGVRWRCWTAEPTEDQRKIERWNE